jgi:hypothetical protein
MKKYFSFALMALLVGGLSMSVTSCKDDDNDGGNGGGATNEESASNDANAFWSVAAAHFAATRQLAGTDAFQSMAAA